MMSWVHTSAEFLYTHVITPAFHYINYHRATAFVLISGIMCALCYISSRASAALLIFYVISNGWQRYFQRTVRRMAWDLRIFALLTNVALALPLLLATDSARKRSQSIHGLLFMSGSAAWLEVSIIVGFWQTKLVPWLKQIRQVHPKWVDAVHGDLSAGDAAVIRIYVQLVVQFLVSGLVGLNFHPEWLELHRGLTLRLLAGTSLFCGLWCQVMANVPPLLRTVSLSLACGNIYILLSNSWEGLMIAILPLGVLSETLPVQLQQLVEMLHVLPMHHTSAAKTSNTASTGGSNYTAPLSDIGSAHKYSDIDSMADAAPGMQRLISAAAEDYPDFQWFGLISFRRLESIIRYIVLAHLALFLPRTQPLSVTAYNHDNLLPPNCPLAVQYIGLVLYVGLPVLSLLDFRWQLRQWYHAMRDYQWA